MMCRVCVCGEGGVIVTSNKPDGCKLARAAVTAASAWAYRIVLSSCKHICGSEREMCVTARRVCEAGRGRGSL